MNNRKLIKVIWFILVLTLVLSGLYFALNIISTKSEIKYSFIPSDIPKISKIFNPDIIISQGLSSGDEVKEFYLDKTNGFLDKARLFEKQDTKFIKKSNLSYVVAGNIYSIDGNKITLYNTKGEKYVEEINLDEINNSKVYLLLMSPTNPTRTEAKVSDMKLDDYLILEKSINLLNDSTKIDISIELLRSAD